MNILHISRTMGQGGAEKIVFQLSEALINSFEKTYVASIGGQLVADLESQGIDHIVIDDIEKKNLKTLFSNYKIFNSLIRKNKIRLVHVHHRMGLVYAQLLRLFNPSLRIVYTAHNIFKDNYFLYQLLLTKVTCIAVGDGVKESLPKKKMNDVIVIYNGVKELEDNYSPTELTDYMGCKILCVARLSEQKGQKYLLESVKQLKAIIPTLNFRVYLLGDGEDREDLQKMITAFDISDEVKLLGYRRNVNDYVKDCDFVVLPSLWEGFPLTPIEVFMNKKTIVATNIKGTDEIVTDENGVLVSPADSNSLTIGLKFLIENPKARQNKEVQAFNDYKSKFSYEQFIAQYEKIFLEEVR
ncbi:glycosyltransferase [Streptococcus sp. S784/96/1]|uniref:glycosyltransferase n=1 Tax=Streptococcus sp. S784/96/1 TaxID=2653499 RepID=UPI001387165E|nr:glycosyltransferase [Streptococcus sp. S784/96/1]